MKSKTPKKSRLLSMMLTLALLLGLLPSGLFTIEAKAADPYDSDKANFTFRALSVENKTAAVYSYNGESTAVKIPDTITVGDLSSTEQAKFTSAGNTASTVLTVAAVASRFLYNSAAGDSIQKVCLGANVTEVQEYAFCGDGGLREVELPTTSKLECIGSYAFVNENLERVGVNGTDKMPSTLKYVLHYSFYQTYNLRSIDLSGTKVEDLYDGAFTNSGISSVTLPDGLLRVGDSVFAGCRNLTSISFPAGIEYFGPRVLKNCISMTEVVLKFDPTSVSTYYDTMPGLSRDCKIWVPQPADQDGYADMIRAIYCVFEVNGGVELGWLDSEGEKITGVSPKSTPTVSSGVVTLGGSDKGKYSSFVYDPTDADGDGLGGVLVLEGSGDDLQLTVNTGSARNCTTVKWTWGQAYLDDRRGTDAEGYDVLRGTELTEDMRRTEALNKEYDRVLNTTVTLRSSANLQGLYYYFPQIINENTSYDAASNSQPQSAADLPPVLVIYRAAINNLTPDTTYKATTSNLCLDTCAETGDYSCSLTKGASMVINGIETWLDYDTPFVQGVTQATGSGRSLTYSWYLSTDGTTSGGTEVASGAALYGGYARAGGDGVYWRCPGPDQEYISGLSAGTYQYYLVVTATDGSTSRRVYTSDLYTLNLYNKLVISSFEYDESEAADPDNFRDAEGNVNYTYQMRSGTKNVVITPVVNLPENFNGTVSYYWYGAADGVTRRTSYFLSDWVDTATNKNNAIKLYIYLDTASGTRLTSASKQCTIYVNTEELVDYKYHPTFDTEMQGQVQYVDCRPVNNIEKFVTINMNGLLGKIASGDNIACNFTPKTTFSVYEVSSPTENWGGEPVIEDVPVAVGVSGEYERTGAVNSNVSVFNGKFRIPLETASSPYTFSDHGVHYFYVKAVNTSGGAVAGVAYSPVFAVIPIQEFVDGNKTAPTQRYAKITSQHPIESVYVPKNDGVTLSVGLELKNVPLTEELRLSAEDSAYVVHWMYDFGDGLYDCLFDPSNFNDVTTEYVVDDLQVSGNEYTIQGRVLITCANKTGGLLDPETGYLCDDGAVGLRLEVDPDAFTDYAITPTKVYSNPLRLYSAAEEAVPTLYCQTGTGGREYVDWGVNSSGTHGYWFKDGDDLIPRNEFWLYSDRYDGKNDDDKYNSPGSETPVTLTAEMEQQGWESGKVVWQVKNSAYPDDPAYNYLISDDGATAPYDTGSASTATGSDGEPKWPAFTDNLTVSVGNSWYEQDGDYIRRSSTLTVAPPNGEKAMTLEITPLAVQTDESGEWESVSPGETFTVRINPVESAASPVISLSGSRYLYLHPEGSAGTVLKGSVTAPDEGTLTLQWYRSTSERPDPTLDTPVGSTITGTGTVDATYTLTEQEMTDLSGGGATTVYYYLYAENYNRAAINTQLQSASSSTVRVIINPSYQFQAKPTVAYSYSGSPTLSVGEAWPEGMFTLKVKKPAAQVSQQVRFEAVFYSANGKIKLGETGGWMPEAEADETGAITIGVGSGDGFTAVEDGDYIVYTITSTSMLGYPKGYGDNRSADYNTEFHWVVEDTWTGDTGYFATGGTRATVETEPFTVNQRRELIPTISAVTVDSAAQTEDVEPYAAMGLPDGTKVTAFQQTYGHDGVRPFTFTPALHSGVSPENRNLNIKLQYFDTTVVNEETGELKGWTEAFWQYAYFPSSSGYSSYGWGYNGAVSGEATSAYLVDYLSYNPEEDVLFLRVAVAAQYDQGEDSTSDVAYSEPFALVRLSNEGLITAGRPQYTGAGQLTDYYPNTYYWNDGAGGEDFHTFGADGWTVEEDPAVTSGGILTYQWAWYCTLDSSWHEIAGATSPIFTVTKSQIANWASQQSEEQGPNVLLDMTATNTNNDPAITGSRTAAAGPHILVCYGPAANVPANVKINGASGEAYTAGAAPDLTVSVSNSGDMGTLTYQWEYLVTESWTDEGEKTSYSSSYWDKQNDATGQTWQVPTLDSGRAIRVPYTSGGNVYTTEINMGADGLWRKYDQVTMQVRCKVTNTESGIEGDAGTVSVYSAPVTLTVKIPDLLKNIHTYAYDGAENLIADVPAVIQDDAAVTLTVREPGGEERPGVSYQWYDRRVGSTSDNTIQNLEDAASESVNLTAANYDTTYPYFVCKVTDGNTGISRYSEPRLLAVSTAGAAATPIVEKDSADDVTCDPNEADGRFFAVSAVVGDGGTLSYQWQEYTSDGWKDLPGQISDTLSLTDLDDAPCRRTFQCVVKNVNGTQVATTTSGSFQLTVRGIVLTRDGSGDPVAGVDFETGLTAQVYGMYHQKVTWSLTGSTAYALAETEQATNASYVCALSNTLTAETAETAALTITATTGEITVSDIDGNSVQRTYTGTLNLALTLQDFAVSTQKVTGKLGQTYTASSPLATLAIAGSGKTITGWAWEGDVPDGLTLNSDGAITGTPTVPGLFRVNVTATASDLTTGTGTVDVIVASPMAENTSQYTLTVNGIYKGYANDTDYSGEGWSWSHEAAVLTLDGYSGGQLYLANGNNATTEQAGLYIRVKNDSAVTVTGTEAAIDYYDGTQYGGICLYGAGGLTVTARKEGVSTHSPNKPLDLTGYRGDLTVAVNSFDSGTSTYGVYGSVTGAGLGGTVSITASEGSSVSGVLGSLSCAGDNNVSVTAMGSTGNVYGVYGGVTAEGKGAVSIDVQAKSNVTWAYGTLGDVTAAQDAGGSLAVTVTRSSSMDGSSTYLRGVQGSLTQSGQGSVTVLAQNNGAKVLQTAAVYGSLTVAGSGEVDVAADGGPSGSQYVYGVNGTDITTSGSIQASVAAYNGDVACGGRPDYAPVLGHTGGSIEFTGETQALTVAPEDVSGFVITGAPEDTYVKYDASAAGDVPVITVDGAEVSGTHSLILQNGVAMEVTIGATCVGGCTVTVDEVNLPAGVTWNSATGVLSGKPTTSGTSSFTVTAVSNADSGKTASLTVNWTVNNILVLHGAVSSYYETGAVQVKQGKMYNGVFLPVVGETPDSWVITVGGEIVTAEYSGGTFWCYPSQGVGENYQTSTLYRFYYDASEAEVGTTVPVSVMPQKGGSDMLAAPVAFDLKVVPANTPDYLLIDNSSYYNPGVNDYDYQETQGWKWTAADQVLQLKGYNGRRIAADNGDLTLKLSNGADNVVTVTDNSTALTADNLTIQDYVGKLKINCGADGTAICADSLTVNAGQLYVTMDEAAEDMWITRNASAEKTLNIGGGTDFKVVLLQGKGADDITVNIDGGVTQYYTYTGSDPDLYLFGNVNPEVAIAVSGDDTVSESKDAVLTASVPAWVTGAVTQDGDPAFGLSYQWQYNNAGTWTGLSGETGSTLVLEPADVSAEGTIGASRAYRYLMSLTYQGTTSITSSSHTVTIASAGVAVTGQVKGYHSGNVPVVQLYAAGDTERTTPLATAALGTAAASGSQYIWSFAFDTVASGTYDLVVTKAGHLTYTVKGVTVGAEDLDLTANSNAAIKLISLLAGDVNGDGSINEGDVSTIRLSGNINKTTSAAANKTADVNGDGSVNEGDVSTVRLAQHINKSATNNCTLDYAE